MVADQKDEKLVDDLELVQALILKRLQHDHVGQCEEATNNENRNCDNHETICSHDKSRYNENSSS